MHKIYYFIIFSTIFILISSLTIDPNIFSDDCFNNRIDECGLFNKHQNETKIIPKSVVHKRFVDPTFRGNPKTQAEIWHRNFNSTSKFFDQSFSLVNLLIKITTSYLNACIPVVLYDMYVMDSESFIVQKLLQIFPSSFVHGKIGKNYEVENIDLLHSKDSTCRHYILFIQDALQTRKIIGPQTTNRVVVVPRSTQWKLQEFLSSTESSDIINLLVIGESFSADRTKERPYVLYTHQLYTDGLGSNKPVVLTSWINGRLSRPHVDLFPVKLRKGFSGHRFLVTAANQPPFVFRRRLTNSVGNEEIKWEGIEVRLLNAFSRMLNFSVEIIEPRYLSLGSGDAVVQEIVNGRGDIGIGGIYTTGDRTSRTDVSVAHSTDCAAFITLTSKALPRYRAIMGPFQWPVWLALTAAYLLAIFPLAFSDKLTLHHLLGNVGEIENMFWYVFGTFTNSLTFTGENSWSNTKKTSTRLLIGWYWVFTIIITACYTGSIIAFVTLPIFPETVDSIDQLIKGFYRVGTLDRGGWERWFSNSTHVKTAKLLKNLEFVANMEEGLSNVTKAFFWSYAFLNSKTHLEYIAQSNFSSEEIGKRSALHISNECFSFFGVSFIYPMNSIYKERFNDAILRFQSSGLMEKVSADVSWAMQRSSTGRLLQASKGVSKKLQTEERGLTLADTEGMFLLLGIGFLIAAGVLLSEWVGGCTNRCRAIIKKRRSDRAEAEAEAEAAAEQAIENAKHSFHPNISKSPQQSSYISLGIDNEIQSSNAESDISDDTDSIMKKKSHHRSKSVIDANLNSQTLIELYNGPTRRHSSLVLINGEMVLETSGSKTKSLDKIDDLEMEQNDLLLTVEVNRPPTPFIHDIDNVFGENIDQ